MHDHELQEQTHWKAKEALMIYQTTGKVISTDPSGLKGDTTTWEYDLATGLELRKTYADGKGTVKTYDAYNNLATVTDARGVVATYTYNLNRGLLTGINFSDGTPAQKFTYNFLGQLTAVQDASGARSISYGRYGSQLEEVQQIASSRFLLQEQRDAYGRGTGYILKRNGNRQCAATVAYGTLGRIALAGFIHAGVEYQFRYGYLAGSNLLQLLAMPNGVTLTQSYEEKRDLLTGMDYVRDNSLITQRQYNYDALGRPVTRDTRYPNKAIHHNDTFAYNKRSELTGALLDENAYTYAYDNIGNREIAQEVAEGITYAANDLNQYTRISTNGENFTPEYDADGNQTLIQTSTGIWKVQYNAQNRAIKFESEDGHTVITCGYDYMGRRFEKKVTSDGAVTLHERYIYRGYLQIAAYDLREGHAEHPDLRFIVWDPTQSVATRPLAIRENGVWYTYGWDLTKNICELYGQEGFIRTIYTYSPYGQVRENESTTQSPRGIGGGLDNAEALPEGRTADGAAVSQPIQWSSEVYDAELGIVYYNYRYYNPTDGRWTRRDPMDESESLITLYLFVSNNVIIGYDELGELFSQNQDICCSKCEEYIEKKKIIYAQEIARMNEKGCDLKIVCSSIGSEGATGGSRHGTIKITIDCKTGATQPMDSPEDTFGHELVHAQDRCDGRLGFFNFCKAVICSEVKAYTVGGCKNKVGPELIECLKRRVPTESTDSSCWLKNKDEIGDLINEDFRRSCYEQ